MIQQAGSVLAIAAARRREQLQMQNNRASDLPRMS
jgi:hypothetical protein